MSDEAKLGLIAGVLAVVGVAVFGLPKESAAAVKAPETVQVAGHRPTLPPAAVVTAK